MTINDINRRNKMKTKKVTDEELAAADSCIAGLIGWVLSWPVGALRAVVAMKGWEWFVADTFDVPTVSFIQAWGLFMVIAFATFQLDTKVDPNARKPIEEVSKALSMSVLWSGMYFLGFWILSAFV